MKLMLNGKEVTGMGHYVMAGDIKDATAEDSNVLSGKAYYNNNGKREGTMPNRGGMSAELAAGGSVSILEGYHNGEGVVRAQDLASQTAGTAAAANIEAGYTAWVNGEMVEGGLVSREMVETTVSFSSRYFSSSSTRTLPEAVRGKQFIILMYATKNRTFVIRNTDVYYNGKLDTNMSYDPETLTMSNKTTQDMDDANKAYTVFAI